MRTPSRPLRAVAVAAGLAIVLAACGSSGSSSNTNNTTAPTSAGSTATVASSMVLGGPAECPTRPYCEVGLQNTYKLHFKSFKPLDAGGPLTVAALGNNAIQIGLLFTTNGQIAAKGWVLLKDDKNLQPADNVTPVLNNKIATAYGKPLNDFVNSISAKITTEDLFALEEWRRRFPDVRDGPGYRDFGSFKLCGDGQYPKTFLLKGQPAHGQEVE